MPTLTLLSRIAIVLGFITAVIILADAIAHPQQMAIRNVVWPVTGLYFPPIGLWFYSAIGCLMAPARHRALEKDRAGRGALSQRPVAAAGARLATSPARQLSLPLA